MSQQQVTVIREGQQQQLATEMGEIAALLNRE